MVDDASTHTLQAVALYTRIESLKTSVAPELRRRGNGFAPSHEGQTWKDHHDSRQQYKASEPEVVLDQGKLG